MRQTYFAVMIAAVLVFFLGSYALADEQTEERGVVTWGASTPTEEPKAVENETVVVESETEIEFSVRQRRALGLTLVNLRRIHRELDASGAYEELDGLSRAERRLGAAVLITQEFVNQNEAALEAEGKAMGLVSQKDWDAFFDALFNFIERLLPLIIGLFF